jgi:hypothetical protein
MNRLHRQRAHVSLLADPPGSQVSGALQTLWECNKTLPIGGEKCSSCGALSEDAGVESENEVKAGVGVDSDVEDGIDIGIGVNIGGRGIFCYWIEE